MYKHIICFLFVIIVAQCDINVDFKIVGGEPAKIRDIPYQVSIQYRQLGTNSYNHICGGTLIRSSVILTAAHCIINNGVVINPSNLMIMAGNNMLNAIIDVQRIGVHKIIHHDYKSSNSDNDIALIHTLRDFNITETVKLAPIRRISTNAGENCTASGWGLLVEGSQTIPIQLMKVDVPIYDQNQCKRSYPHLTSNMICAGEKSGGKDSCQGDSGGPLVCKGEVTGIVSHGYGCARPDYPGVYTNVVRYAKWIDVNSAAGSLSCSITMTVMMLYLLKIYKLF